MSKRKTNEEKLTACQKKVLSYKDKIDKLLPEMMLLKENRIVLSTDTTETKLQEIELLRNDYENVQAGLLNIRDFAGGKDK